MNPATTYHTLRFEMKGNTGLLLLNQPPSNKMNIDFFVELDQLISELKKADSLKALVISGTGRHFSSGASPDELIEKLANGESQDIAFFERNSRAFDFFSSAPFPVISAIRGVCIGSAMEMTLFSHFRFSSDEAVFGLPESGFGLMPGIGGISHLAALTGKARTLELVLRGNMFPAQKALEYGIIDKIIPRKELLDYAFTFAEKIAGNYQKAKKSIYLTRADEN
ncbi:MAG: enoyl-CoA hydratase/isomerase family protein [Syntrophothermus sp.]